MKRKVLQKCFTFYLTSIVLNIFQKDDKLDHLFKQVHGFPNLLEKPLPCIYA